MKERQSMKGQTPETLYDFANGEPMAEKPEHYTHLYGGALVPKSHPRIVFRGQLDTLMAQVISLELEASRRGQNRLIARLEELKTRLAQVMASEVKEEIRTSAPLFGLSPEDVHYRAHHPQEFYGVGHIFPDYTMGSVAVGLNLVRTYLRQCEVGAVIAFEDELVPWQESLIQELNLLGSGVYILYCKHIGRATQL